MRLFAGIRNSVESEKNADGRLLVIFDGHCALCSRTVRWLIKRDRRDRLRFAASESRRGLGMLRKQAEEGSSIFVPPATILVLRHAGAAAEQLLKRSDAIVSLLGELPRAVAGGGHGARADSANTARLGLQGRGALALPHLGTAGKLPVAYSARRGAGSFRTVRAASHGLCANGHQ